MPTKFEGLWRRSERPHPYDAAKEISLLRTQLRNRVEHPEFSKALEELQAVVDLYEFDPAQADLTPSRLMRVLKRDDSYLSAQAAKIVCSEEEGDVADMVACKQDGEPPYPRDWIEFIAGFIAADGKDRSKMQRCYRISGNRITHPPGVDDILRGVRLLPDAIATHFRITPEEYDMCKRAGNASLLDAQMTGARDFSAERHVEVSREFLRQNRSMYKLILGLCALSGRRQTEITNGRSTFSLVDKEPRCLWFNGQLKTDACRYKIPVLGVSGEEFIEALERLRLRQRHPRRGRPFPCRSSIAASANGISRICCASVASARRGSPTSAARTTCAGVTPALCSSGLPFGPG